MALVIPPGFAQCAWRFALTGDADIMIVTCGLDITGLGGPQAAADAASGAFGLAFPASEIIASYAFVGVGLAVGQDGGPPVVYESDEEAHQGTYAAAPLPQNCAFLIRKQTAVPGRAGRGRMYLPPFYLPEGSVDAIGMMTVEARGNFQDLVDEWFTGLDPVLLHDSESPVSTPSPISSFIVQRQLATQRRRLR